MTLVKGNGMFLIFLLAGFALVASDPQEVDCRTLGEQDEQYCGVVCNGTQKLSALGLPLCAKDKDILDTRVQTTCICQERVGGEGVIKEDQKELTVRSVCHPVDVESPGNCQPCMAATEVRYECRIMEDTRGSSLSSTSRRYCACALSGTRQRRGRGGKGQGGNGNGNAAGGGGGAGGGARPAGNSGINAGSGAGNGK